MTLSRLCCPRISYPDGEGGIGSNCVSSTTLDYKDTRYRAVILLVGIKKWFNPKEKNDKSFNLWPRKVTKWHTDRVIHYHIISKSRRLGAIQLSVQNWFKKLMYLHNGVLDSNFKRILSTYGCGRSLALWNFLSEVQNSVYSMLLLCRKGEMIHICLKTVQGTKKLLIVITRVGTRKNKVERMSLRVTFLNVYLSLSVILNFLAMWMRY